MTINTLPMLASSFDANNVLVTNATGTTIFDLTTINATKTTRIESLSITYHVDTSKYIVFYLYDGTTQYFIGYINSISATIGANGSSAPLNLLTHTCFSSIVQTDDIGNKFLDIPAGWKIQASLGPAMTSGQTMYIFVKSAILETGVKQMSPQTMAGKLTDFTSGNGTGVLTIVSSDTTPTRLDSLTIMNTDPSNAKTIQIRFYNGSTTTHACFIDIPANTGMTNALPQINVLSHANFAPFVQTDAAGNKFLDIPAGWSITAMITVAPTSNIQVYARWAKYGSSGVLTYTGARTYIENGKGAKWSNASGSGTGSALDLTTANDNGPIRINSIVIMFNDVTARDMQFLIHDGTIARDLTTINLTSTWTGYSALLNALAHTNFAPFIGTDLAGNKYLELPAGWKLQAYLDTTLSGSYQAQISTRWSNYGY